MNRDTALVSRSAPVLLPRVGLTGGGLGLPDRPGAVGARHVSIGDGCAVNAESWFEGHGRIVIGHHCFIGPQVMIITSVHEIGPGYEVARQPSCREVRIGDRCWVGARATILPGASIGAGTVVAAGSVVTKDCEPGAVYADVPARRLR